MSEPRRIPCHLITGPLGVGKTTAIIDYLRRNAGRQFVAVLVNDFGPVGLDGAIIEGDAAAGGTDGEGQAKVMMVPGGCICCSAAAGLVVAFRQLAKLPRLDRIIIEPSGIALVGEMVDLLGRMLPCQESDGPRMPDTGGQAARGTQHGNDAYKGNPEAGFELDLRPVITLMDPRSLDKPAFTRVFYFVRMIEAADILVANRCDLAGEAAVGRFREWAAALYPPKLRVIVTDHGRLPDEVFDLTAGERGAAAESLGYTIAEEIQRESYRPSQQQSLVETRPPSAHTHGHHADGATWPAEAQFRLARAEALLGAMARDGLGGVAVARLKGILHTEQGWRLMEIACGEVFCRPTDYRRDNRIDWITEGAAISAGAMRDQFMRTM